MSTRTIVVLVIAALAVLYGAWFVSTHDLVVEQQRVGPTGEARLRDFLAAERFAERMGWKVSEVRSLPALHGLPQNGVLLLPNGRQSLDRTRLLGLLEWVAKGGHAIIEAERSQSQDPLLEALNVGRVTKEWTKAPAPLPPEMFDAIGLKTRVEPGGRSLTVIFNQSVRLRVGDRRYRLRVTDQGEVALVSFEHGKGVVTVSSTLGFARNGRIGLQDNAEFLWNVLAMTPGRELFVYWAPTRLSLWRFLMDNAAPLLIAGGFLLALWLWSIVPRFGPVAPDAPPGRRRLLDHLRASGRYYWGRGMRSRLVFAARDAALRRVARAQPDFPVAPGEERVTRLATLAGISKEEAAAFMSAAGATRGADFIRTVQHAQRIHAALEKGIRK